MECLADTLDEDERDSQDGDEKRVLVFIAAVTHMPFPGASKQALVPPTDTR
jgi:hypothetical protein